MSFSSLRIRVRACSGFRLLAIGILLWPLAAFAEPSGDIITVNVDQAKLIRLPTRVATIVVGNPLIADVTLQTGGVVVLTGKGYGSTNFIAMDRTGEILVDRVIQVEGPTSLSRCIAASNASRIAACRFASGGLPLATARAISNRRWIRPALSAARPAAREPDRTNSAARRKLVEGLEPSHAFCQRRCEIDPARDQPHR
jgi:Pilus formation protein N terminal region